MIGQMALLPRVARIAPRLIGIRVNTIKNAGGGRRVGSAAVELVVRGGRAVGDDAAGGGGWVDGG